MTPHQIRLVQHSFALVTDADAVARVLYDRLFATAPALRPLFPADLAAQRGKLMTMIATAVSLLDRPAVLVPALQALGRRHRGYRVQDEHYAPVGAALLWTLEQGLGPRFDAETRAAWTALYALAATTMQEAARADAA